MKRRNFVTLALQASIGFLAAAGSVLAQRGRGGGGRSARQSGGVNRSGASRSGSARTSTPKKSSPSQSPGRSSGARNSRGRRTVPRGNTKSRRHRSRRRTRRVSTSRRMRRSPWRHHRYRRHRRWYRGRWVGLVFITVAAFGAISASSTTHTYSSVTYYHVNPWYRAVLREGEEGYVLSAAPVGHREDQLPDGSETAEVDGKTYYWADAGFWQKASGGGYVVVQAPVGAEVSSIPEESASETEGEVTIYQFDDLYFTKDTNSSGKTIYRVEPRPPEEEIESIPPGSPSFVADQETFYYVDFSFYVEFAENGTKGFVNGEPEIGAQVDKLPDEVTTVEEGGVTYYQFDSVFFEQVEDDNGGTFYEVVGSPDGSDQEVEN